MRDHNNHPWSAIFTEFIDKIQQLPIALYYLFIKLILTGIGVGVISCSLAVYLHSIGPLLPIAATLACFYKAIDIVFLWNRGEIIERTVVCLSVSQSRFKKTCCGTFKMLNNEPTYYAFVLSKSAIRTVNIGQIYKIYSMINMQDMLLTDPYPVE